jgi:hypothetical protein
MSPRHTAAWSGLTEIYGTDAKLILNLMEAFGWIDSSFRQVGTREEAERCVPGTEREKKEFAELAAMKNRSALKAWYAVGGPLNPHAELFRQVLERAIGEGLPINCPRPRGPNNQAL